MIEYIENLTGIDIYYFAVMIITLFIGFVASWKHNKALPFVWAGIMTAILYFGYELLYPILTGWIDLEMYSLFWFLGMFYSITWAIILAIAFKNMATTGEIIQ